MMRFALTLAWRDGKREFHKLLLCVIAIVFGVTGLVAINSFGDNLKQAIDNESKTLLGADLQISSRVPFSEKTRSFFKRIGGEQASETNFTSMAYFTRQDDSRLVMVKAMEGRFPFYGELETEPPNQSTFEAEEPVILVDHNLKAQFGLKNGDTLKLGQVVFTIIGSIQKIPGDNTFFATFAPKVIIPQAYLQETGLLQRGSVVRYNQFFKLPPNWDFAVVENAKNAFFADERLSYQTVETKKKNVGQSLDNLYRFLKLVAFIALLLGGIGIAGGISVYLKSKLSNIALLRCVGMSKFHSVSVYWIQISAVSLLSIALGCALGVAIQFSIPALVAPFIPFTLEAAISWPSILGAFLTSWCLVLAFAIFPFLPIRKLNPLSTLRSYTDLEYTSFKDPFFWMAALFLTGIVLIFSMLQAQKLWHGAAFTAGTALAIALILLFAYALRAFFNKVFHKFGSFPVRIALANLHRPNNRTAFLMLTLGTGTFLIHTLFLIEHSLMNQDAFNRDENEPNLLFFDVQWDQQEGLHALLADSDLKIIDEAPVVTMRLAKIKDRTLNSLRADPDSKIKKWILNREWRSTYRDYLKAETETILEGTFTKRFTDIDKPVPISLEEGMAKDLEVQLGDSIVFDVQGIEIETFVDSIRKVDWQRMRSNFFTVFPAGILDDAPKFFISFTQTATPEDSARIQRDVVKKFPNITAVDLRIILNTLQSLLEQVRYVLQFMGSFTVLTGIIVLISALLTSRYQRIQESILLRTLGASKKQIHTIISVEFLLVGILSATLGILLATSASWALAQYVFKTGFKMEWVSLPVVLILVSGTTWIVAQLCSRGIATFPPLVILRKE